MYVEEDDVVEFVEDETFWANNDNDDDVLIEEDRHNVHEDGANLDDWGENDTGDGENDEVCPIISLMIEMKDL